MHIFYYYQAKNQTFLTFIKLKRFFTKSTDQNNLAHDLIFLKIKSFLAGTNYNTFSIIDSRNLNFKASDIDWFGENAIRDDHYISGLLKGSKPKDTISLIKDSKIDSTIDSTIETNLRLAILQRDTIVLGLNDITSQVMENIVTVILSSTYPQSVTESSKLYYTLDMGWQYNYYLDDFLWTLSLTIYFRPINPNIPLSHYNNSICDFISTRFGLMAGISLNSVENKVYRKGILDNKAIFIGSGFRILPWLKITSGYMFLKAKNINQLNEDFHTKGSPYFGFSIDFNIAETIKNTFTTHITK